MLTQYCVGAKLSQYWLIDFECVASASYNTLNMNPAKVPELQMDALDRGMIMGIAFDKWKNKAL